MALANAFRALTRGNATGTPVTPGPGSEVLLFFLNGESNSVGYSFNSEAPSGELGLRSNVQILNNTSLVFEQLNIGVNNDSEIGGTHGWELGIANQMSAGGIGSFTQVYIVKTGKGGTRIADWNVGGTWYTRMQTRMTAALNAIAAMGKTPKIICLYSQGINDVPTNTVPVWKADTIAHFSNIRGLYGASMPILMTKFLSPHAVFNTAMDEIDSADPNTVAIDATGTTKNPDGAHWDYAGSKLLASRFITETLNFL